VELRDPVWSSDVTLCGAPLFLCGAPYPVWSSWMTVWNSCGAPVLHSAHKSASLLALLSIGDSPDGNRAQSLSTSRDSAQRFFAIILAICVGPDKRFSTKPKSREGVGSHFATLASQRQKCYESNWRHRICRSGIILELARANQCTGCAINSNDLGNDCRLDISLDWKSIRKKAGQL